MKKIVLGILVISSLLYCSCSSGSGDTPAASDGYIYEIPAGQTQVSFPSECNGKRAFAIYLNQTAGNIAKGNGGIRFNQNDDGAFRSADDNDRMIIYQDAIEFEDGFRRTEVHFELPYLPQKSQSSARSINENPHYSYSERTNSIGSTGDFYAQIGQSNTTTHVQSKTFTLKATGRKCKIWYYNTGNDGTYFNTYNFQRLADSIDRIFVRETQIFGSHTFNISNGFTDCITVTSDKKLNVLVYDLFNDRTNNSSPTRSTMGFQRPSDLFLNEALADNRKISNECEVINIDSYYLENRESDAISTLAHEFTHLLITIQKYFQEDTWFTEMLAMCSEDIFQQTLGLTDNQTSKGRFDVSFNTPWKGFKNWPDEPNSESHLLYANTYAFGAYLMRNYGGINLIHQISTNDYLDEGAITMALQTLGYQEDFTTVLKKFGAIYVYPESSNYYSLNKSVTQSFAGTTYNLTAINLNNYFFLYQENTTQEDFIDYINTNCYYPNPQIGHDNTATIWGAKGPIIFKSSFIPIDSISGEEIPIQTYGFRVYYLGTVNSDTTYSVTPVSNMTTIVCVKD